MKSCRILALFLFFVIFTIPIAAQPAPDFTAFDAEGRAHRLSDYRGGVVLVSVWSAQRSECLTQKTALSQWLMEAQPTDLTVLFVNIDLDEQQWLRYVQQDALPPGSRHLGVSDGLKSDFAAQYAIGKVPRYILVNAAGHIVQANAPDPGLALATLIQEALGQ